MGSVVSAVGLLALVAAVITGIRLEGTLICSRGLLWTGCGVTFLGWSQVIGWLEHAVASHSGASDSVLAVVAFSTLPILVSTPSVAKRTGVVPTKAQQWIRVVAAGTGLVSAVVGGYHFVRLAAATLGSLDAAQAIQNLVALLRSALPVGGSLITALVAAESGVFGARLRHHAVVRAVGTAVFAALYVPVGCSSIVWTHAKTGVACGRVGDIRGVVVDGIISCVATLVVFALLAPLRVKSDTAAVDGNFPLLQILVDVLPMWRSPTQKLRYLASSHNIRATRRALGPLPNVSNQSAAAIAQEQATEDLVRELHGVVVDSGKVRTAIAAGADPNSVGKGGQTALHAVRDRATVAALLEAGANPNLPDHEGSTAVHATLGSVFGGDNTVDLILDPRHGSDMNAVDRHGKTPFMQAWVGLREQAAPVPTWIDLQNIITATPLASVAAAVLTATPSPDNRLQRLQLLDLLWDTGLEPDEARRRLRRRWVFDHLVAPLIRAATERSLTATEKALLVHACRATAGPGLVSDAEPVTREGHALEFAAATQSAMAVFENELDTVYRRTMASLGGNTLAAISPSTFLNGYTQGTLCQDAATVGGVPEWLTTPTGDGDLIMAFHQSLAPLGVATSAEQLCALLQGRHQLLGGETSRDFRHSAPPFDFWIHVCAIIAVARHEAINTAFHDAVRSCVSEVKGALFTAASRKGFRRVVAKAQAYARRMGLPGTAASAGVAVGRVLDIARCSVVVGSVDDLLAVCRCLESATLRTHRLLAVCWKNGFHRDVSLSGGYRDVKFSLLFEGNAVPDGGPPCRVIAEIQLLLESYVKVKKRMHAVYRVARRDFG